MTRRLLLAGLAAALACALLVPLATAKPVSGPGKVRIGADASVWDSSVPPSPGILPIGGAGQINGEFATATRYGIEIGIRAQERLVGPIEPTTGKNNRVGVYDVETGESSPGRAWWNYDWHVDLSGAKGVARDTSLEDYDLTLETDIAPALFGFPVPVDLTFGGAVPGDTILYQSSQNPTFGNAEFDLSDEETYSFKLVLTPATFNGPPLAAAMTVVASTP